MNEAAWEARVSDQKDQVSKAFVSLCVDMPYQEKDKRFAAFSGFVFSVEGQWVWVTAEHVFTGHDKHVGLDKLLEVYPETAVYLQPIPGGQGSATPFYPINPSRLSTSKLAETWRGKVDDLTFEAIIEADILCFGLSDYYKKNLQAVGVQPLKWDDVRSLTDEEALSLLKGKTITFVLFGVPANSIDATGEKPSAWLMYLPLEQIEDNPPFSYWNPTWDKNEVPHDVRGMSGGPIMMLGADNPYLMGIQIAQKRVDGQYRLKAVNGFPFFEFIASWVRKVRETEGVASE